MEPRYLLVCYDNSLPMDHTKARRKYISKSDYDLVVRQIAIDLELEDIKYDIIEIRTFNMKSDIAGATNFVILDVKRKENA
jgi:hypothetical protein